VEVNQGNLFLLAGFYRIACFHPGLETAQDGIYISISLAYQELCRTGTGCLVNSGAVGEDQRITRCVHFVIAFGEGNADRTRNVRLLI